jgi:hypothetical protein
MTDRLHDSELNHISPDGGALNSVIGQTDKHPDPGPARRAASIHELCEASAITLDIDWAPDWCIEQAYRTLVIHGARATFFVTHRSPVIDELLDDDRFEVGIHLNFLAHTTQGCSTEEILDPCLAIAPDARAIRTHSLFQSLPLLQLLTSKYAQIDVDVSLFLPVDPDLRPVAWHYSQRISAQT